jgi:hypothetical protein
VIPIRRYLGQAIHALQWSPAVFWAATLHELQAAFEAADPDSMPDEPTPEYQALLDAVTGK